MTYATEPYREGIRALRSREVDNTNGRNPAEAIQRGEWGDLI